MQTEAFRSVRPRAIRAILSDLVLEFGRPTRAPLRQWSDEQCESFLASLPLVGLKTARCVMLYSLGRAVFPVDVHCCRVSRRLGWIRATRADGWCSDLEMDALQEAIPPEHRYSLHVNVVAPGP